MTCGGDDDGGEAGPEDGGVYAGTEDVEEGKVEREHVHVVGEGCRGLQGEEDEGSQRGEVGLRDEGEGDEDPHGAPQRLHAARKAVARDLGERVHLEGEERGGK